MSWHAKCFRFPSMAQKRRVLKISSQIVTKNFERVILCNRHKVSLGPTEDQNFNQTIAF